MQCNETTDMEFAYFKIYKCTVPNILFITDYLGSVIILMCAKYIKSLMKIKRETQAFSLVNSFLDAFSFFQYNKYSQYNTK